MPISWPRAPSTGRDRELRGWRAVRGQVHHNSAASRHHEAPAGGTPARAVQGRVRRAGLALGLPEAMVWRHPPLPRARPAVRNPRPGSPPSGSPSSRTRTPSSSPNWEASGWYRKTSQCFAVLLPVMTVGIMGDERTYENMCALRAVTWRTS